MPEAPLAEKLSAQLTGSLILPDDAEYNTYRSVWNGMIDRQPAMIARCKTVDDIVAAVQYARSQSLSIAVKGGGHGVAGRCVCDGGVMIDLGMMNDVTVDPQARTATVGPGARLGDLDRETQKHGLATTGGIVSATGVAGLTLGGGFGYLARKHGLTLDNLLSAELVTAEGERLRVSTSEHDDLFWAIRGGGGNFGVVSSFEFQLHELSADVLVAQVFYPYDQAERVLRAYRDLMAEAPDDLAVYALAVHVPPTVPFPEEWQGKQAIALVACYSGDHDKGKSLLTPLTQLGDPVLQMVAPMPYTVLQSSFDAGVPDGERYYWKNHFVRELTDAAIADFVEQTQTLPGPLSIVGFEPLGGAIGRVDPDATAFAHRDASFALGIWAGWTDPANDDAAIAWTRKMHEVMAPHATGGLYMNYLDQDDNTRVSDAFGTHLERLRRIKTKYDPDNVFCQNHNITPEK